MNALIQTATLSLRKFRARQKGQTLVEYTILLAVITVIAIGVFALLGTRIQMLFSAITLILDTAQSSS